MALAIARHTHSVILCADSLTVYRELDVGTAKPSYGDQQEIKHYGLDLVAPDERFTVADFVQYAKNVINQVDADGGSLIVTGGSGLYVDALLYDYSFRDDRIHTQHAQTMSHEELFSVAKRLYPHELKTFDVKNTRRLRELVMRGPANTRDRHALKYSTKILGITHDRAILQKRIAKRTINMLNHGFVQEAISIQKRFGDVKPLHATGYKQVLHWLKRKNDNDIAELAHSIDKATWQLVRKQYTWFRRNPYIVWLDSLEAARTAGIDYLRST